MTQLTAQRSTPPSIRTKTRPTRHQVSYWWYLVPIAVGFAAVVLLPFLANIGNMWATEPNYTPEQLAAITTEIEQRPDLLRSRTDLLEQMHLTRCWCLHRPH